MINKIIEKLRKINPVEFLVRFLKQPINLRDLNKRLKSEINERKLIENRLDQISGEWRKTFDSTQDVMVMMNSNFEVVRSNSASILLFKKGFHAMNGERIGKLFSKIQMPVDMANLKKVRETKRREELEIFFPENKRWFVISVDPVLDNLNSVTGSVLVMRDITELKAMQESLMNVKNDWEDTFNTITDMITIHDKDYNIIRANDAARRMMNIPDPETGGSLKCFKYYHGTDKPPEMCPSCKCLKTGKFASFDIYEPYLDKYVEIRSIPRIDKDNNIIGLIHVARDISDIRKASEEKRKLQEQLIHVQKMDSIGRLAGGVAHDFNNIVSVIIGYSELALKDLPEGSALKDNILAIHGAGEKAASLTKKLLAFSRKQVLEMKAVNMERIIENMTKILIRLIPEDVTLTFNSQTNGQKVLADPTQMEQILMNLVVNARDAMPDGGLLAINTSEVRFEERQAAENENMEPGSYLLLSVTDTGTGMSREVQDKIFEPFFSTKEVGKGTGMGLATVYGIVKQHNGHIDVQSEPGKGTTFLVYLPVAEGEIEEVIEHKPERIVTGSETILVVDDESLLRNIIVEMLKPLGYKVLSASNADEALQISGKFGGRIDLLLTDVIMPGMNGKKLADILTTIRPEMKVVFISGYTDDAIAHHGVLDEGIVLIQKPITEKILANKIREVLDADNLPKAACKENNGLDGLQILLADDNEDIRLLIKVFLKDYDCRVDTAENGNVAVDKFKLGKYGLVLMDMQMPVMDGTEAIREIRKWEKEKGVGPITIIALTGNAAPKDIAKCLEAGSTSHLAKPISRDRLTREIFSHIAAKQNNERATENRGGEKMVAHIDEELKDLIPEYLEERQNDIMKIQKAIQTQDYETVRITGHTLKGSGGGYGFEPVTEIGSQIEEAAIEKDRDKIRKWTRKLTDYIENVEVVYE